MKTMKTIYCIFLIALIFCWVKAHSQTTENALLWEVSGNGLEKSSYIYGTMHMVCEEDYIFPEVLSEAVNKADQVILEIDMDAPDLMTQMQASIMSPIPLSKKLSAEDYKALDSVLLQSTSMSLSMLDNMTLQAISSIMMLKSLPCEAPKSYEADLAALATEKQKEVRGLETIADQMEFMGKAFSDEFLLQQLLDYHRYEGVFAEMVKSYNDQNLNELYTFVTDEKYADQDTEKWLLVERNKNWVEILPEMISSESSLIAVGAAHLPGKSGIIELLKSKGYSVKPIRK